MPLQICWIVNPTLIMPTEMLRIGFPRFWDAYCDTSVRVVRAWVCAAHNLETHLTWNKQMIRVLKLAHFFDLKKRSFPEFIMHFLWGKCTQILIQLTEGRETSPFYTLSMDSQKQLRILQWSSIKVKKRILFTIISIFLNIYILFGQKIKLGTS